MRKIPVLVMVLLLILFSSCSSGIAANTQTSPDLQSSQSQYDELLALNQILETRISKLESEKKVLEAKVKELDDTNTSLITSSGQDIAALQEEIGRLEAGNQQLSSILNIGPNSTLSKEYYSDHPEEFYSSYYKSDSSGYLIQDHTDAVLKKGHSLFGNTNMDIYEKAIYIWRALSRDYINSIIVLGNLKNDKAEFSECQDVWLRVLDGEMPPRVFYVDAATGSMVFGMDFDGNIINTEYSDYRGFWYRNPLDFRSDIAYRWLPD